MILNQGQKQVRHYKLQVFTSFENRKILFNIIIQSEEVNALLECSLNNGKPMPFHKPVYVATYENLLEANKAYVNALQMCVDDVFLEEYKFLLKESQQNPHYVWTLQHGQLKVIEKQYEQLNFLRKDIVFHNGKIKEANLFQNEYSGALFAFILEKGVNIDE